MYRTLLSMLAFAFAAVAFAQQDASDLFAKAPPDVDRALRARITEFFQDHVTAEYRKAEKLVAEDTQDYFYDHGKPRYVSFEIKTIKYNKDFTQADAMVMCKQSIMMPGFNGQVMDIPTPSSWKLENGQWFWWVDPAKRNLTPFSEKPMQGGPFKEAGPMTMGTIPTNQEELYAMVKADKTVVNLKPGASENVLIGNGMPGPIMPEVVQKPKGVDVTFAEKQIRPASQSAVTVKAGEKAEAGDLVIRINPIGKLITIQVLVQQ